MSKPWSLYSRTRISIPTTLGTVPSITSSVAMRAVTLIAQHGFATFIASLLRNRYVSWSTFDPCFCSLEFLLLSLYFQIRRFCVLISKLFLSAHPLRAGIRRIRLLISWYNQATRPHHYRHAPRMVLNSECPSVDLHFGIVNDFKMNERPGSKTVPRRQGIHFTGWVVNNT